MGAGLLGVDLVVSGLFIGRVVGWIEGWIEISGGAGLIDFLISGATGSKVLGFRISGEGDTDSRVLVCEARLAEPPAPVIKLNSKLGRFRFFGLVGCSFIFL